jgi:hypothetical protein
LIQLGQRMGFPCQMEDRVDIGQTLGVDWMPCSAFVDVAAIS